jgi:putative endonuclease
VSKEKGHTGESLAVAHLEALGFEIVEQNYRFRRSEVDIIALLDNRLLVFVEVKLRTNTSYGQPETFVTKNQEKKILEAADEYIHATNWQKNIRFDIITIDAQGHVGHIEDAFY